MAESLLVRKGGGGAKLNGAEIDVVLNGTVQAGDFLQWSDDTVSSLDLAGSIGVVNNFLERNVGESSWDAKFVVNRFWFSNTRLTNNNPIMFRSAYLIKQTTSPEFSIHFNQVRVSNSNISGDQQSLYFLNNTNDLSVAIQTPNGGSVRHFEWFGSSAAVDSWNTTGGNSFNVSVSGAQNKEIAKTDQGYGVIGWFSSSSCFFSFYDKGARNKYELTTNSFSYSNITAIIGADNVNLWNPSGGLVTSFLIQRTNALDFRNIQFFFPENAGTPTWSSSSDGSINSFGGTNIRPYALGITTSKNVEGRDTDCKIYATTTNSSGHLQLSVFGATFSSSPSQNIALTNYNFNNAVINPTFILDLTQSKKVPTVFDRRKLVFYVDTRNTNDVKINIALLNESNTVIETFVITQPTGTNRPNKIRAYKYDEDTVVVFWTITNSFNLFYQIIKLRSRVEKTIIKDYFVGVALQSGTSGQTIKMIRYI
jgi:hypothetical protein